MTKPCHLVVKLGKTALEKGIRYKVYLKTPVKHVFEKVLKNAGDYAEIKYSNEGPTDIQYCDIQGDGSVMTEDGEDFVVGFGCTNYWVGYPQGVVGYTSDFNPCDLYDHHKFSENESYQWSLEYSDGINPERWYRTYTMRRLEDTDSKEFVLWLDD